MTVKGIGRWIDGRLARFKEHPHRVLIECVLLFSVSFALEWILSLDMIYTASGRWLSAGATSFVIEYTNLGLGAALFSTGAMRSWKHFLSTALGSSFGAMVAVAVAA